MTDLPESKEPTRIKVEDRRHWARVGAEEESTGEPTAEETAPPASGVDVDALRSRAETAEGKLREYAAAFQQWRSEQEQFRHRLERDVETRVAIRFGELVSELLEMVDDLDRALEHAETREEAAALVQGIVLARDRFLATLNRHGVERLDLDGTAFDPNVAEAVVVEPVEDASADGTVVRTVRSGYRLGDRIVRAARVVVGRALS